MKYKKRLLFIGILFVLAVITRWYSSSSIRVEAGYSTGFYGGIAAVLRLLFGWLPFSAGDILYGLVAIWAIWKLVQLIKIIYRKKASKEGFIKGCLKLITILLLLYIVFNGLWGINYNRKGIAYQLGLKMDKYSLDDLKNINGLLITKVN